MRLLWESLLMYYDYYEKYYKRSPRERIIYAKELKK